jgi:hypothetical protein
MVVTIFFNWRPFGNQFNKKNMILLYFLFCQLALVEAKQRFEIEKLIQI